MVTENNKYFAEFKEITGDLLENTKLLKLDNFSHHLGVTRFQHSVNVGYYSFVLAKKLGLKTKETARGGLLHDLFHYECSIKKFGPFKHAALHPKLALRNAKRIYDINKVEEDIILKHMWLANLKFPRYRESYLVSFIDKACAVYEAIFTLYSMVKKRWAVN